MALTEEDNQLIKLFDTLGRFVVLARRLKTGATITGAVRELDISRATALTDIKWVEEQYRRGKLIKAPEGRPVDQRTTSSLTPAGEEVFEQVERSLLAALPAGPPVEDVPLMFAIEDEPLLAELLSSVLAIDSTVPGIEMPPLNGRSRTELEDALAAKKPTIDVAAVWAEPGHQFEASGVKDQWLEPTLDLVLISRDAARLRAVCPHKAVDLESVRKMRPTIAYPDGFPAAGRMCRTVGRAEKKQSIAAVLFEVLAGTVQFGVMPALFQVLDEFQMVRRLAAARFPKTSQFTIGANVVLLARENVPSDKLVVLRKPLETLLASYPVESSFDTAALDRDLPTTPAQYSGTYFGYFVETFANENPGWSEEVIRIGESSKTRRGNPARDGGHSVVFEDGELVNRAGEVFKLEGGVMSDYLLYFRANQAPGTNPEKLVKGWPSLKEFLKEFLPDWDQRSGSGRKRKSSGKPISFLALFPYFRKHRNKKLWLGFWLGIDRQRHPLANGIVMSEGKLTSTELGELSRVVKVRSMMAAAAFDCPDVATPR